jgi:hypothetical protein
MDIDEKQAFEANSTAFFCQAFAWHLVPILELRVRDQRRDTCVLFIKVFFRSIAPPAQGLMGKEL